MRSGHNGAKIHVPYVERKNMRGGGGALTRKFTQDNPEII